MAYIGNIPADKYTSFAKQDFTVTATTSYTLDHSVSNENEIALFINFVRQEPTTAYTATGTSLTISEATSVGDDMYCVFIGKAVQTVTPADNTISNSMIIDGAIDNAAIASDAAIASTKLFSGFKNGITMADQWRLATDRASDEDPIGSSSTLERVDETSYGKIGTGMTNTSGIFSFPETGLYLVELNAEGLRTSSNDNVFDVEIMVTTNNSTYDRYTLCRMAFTTEPNTGNVNGKAFVNVTDISNVKVKFKLGSTNSNTLKGNTAYNRTYFTFIRLGDSV